MDKTPVRVVHQPTEGTGWLDYIITRPDRLVKVRVMYDGFTVTWVSYDEGRTWVDGPNIEMGKIQP